MPHVPGKDRRVRKTQGLLHGALASLIHEKSFDAIVVKEILARANVGRSTFYTHFRDKGELLDSGIRDMLHACETSPADRSMGRAEWILRFSLPLLAHVGQFRSSGNSSAGTKRQAVVHDRLRLALTESVADQLARLRRGAVGRRGEMPSELLAQHVACTFVLVLDWWMGSEEPLTAAQANDRFRALILPTLTATLAA